MCYNFDILFKGNNLKQEIFLLQPEKVPHHPIASLHREMSDAEFESLKLDIELNGQLLPIITYKGKLVDGRHRQRALIELGIHDMLCISLPNNTSLEDVRSKVLGTEMRRTDNVAQKAIRAMRWMNESTGRTQADAGIKFAVSRSRVSEANKLLNMIGSDNIDKLYSKGYLIFDGKQYTQLSHIIKHISTDEQLPDDKEPTSEAVSHVFERLQSMFKSDDIVGIAQIEAYAKNLRSRKD